MDFEAVSDTSRLLAVIRDLSFCRGLAGIMEIVRREARELTGADGVTFVLRDGDWCYYAEENAIGPLWKGRRFPIHNCISGWVMLNREVAVIEDIYDDARIPIDAYRPTFVRSLVMVPVRASDPLGAIGAYWATNRQASPTEVETLRTIADATALALQNARLYEDLQAAADRAEALNRARDEWMSVVSHELRTPLTPILGWTRMLQGERLDESRRAHALCVIERNVMAEIRIVEDLLDVSRMMVGTVRLNPSPLDLRQPVEAALETVRSIAEQKQVTILASLPDEPVHVLGDADRLQQAIWNLLTNAVKYSPAASQVNVGLVLNDAQVSVIVRDTGEGIAGDVLPRIFQRFERADSSMKRSRGGLGLGLFIVRTIAELHHGSVSAQSDGPGRGSTFAIHLALAEQPAAAAGPAPAPIGTPTLDGLRVLVVDDDRDALDLLNQCLEASGAEVQTASSVAQAVSLCRAGAIFDAVVSDLAMPHENGFDLLAQLQQMGAPARHTPVIALTAHASPHDSRRALESGFRMYLAKPIDPIAVTRAVRSVVGGGPRGVVPPA